ncbi:MAG: ParB/RepB/Spo0J family partition protein [Flavobacteriaceae bacterium]|nr:ParB/RepB/Spo0J family partition protein [Flavobacteriaceae bacterium]MCY4266349.1 ParB/RepB/Spo0J family partition protein [Flavobacteriaceae bacterium]
MGKSTKKPALGKGLGSILRPLNSDTQNPKDFTSSVVGRVLHLSPDKIKVNAKQPRQDFEPNALKELAQSVRLHGIIQPITIRKNSKTSNYELISGERRLRAAQIVGLKKIPSYVRIAHDEEMLKFALIENIHRSNLNPIEVGLTYSRLIKELKLTHQDLSGIIAKPRSSITNYIRLLKLPDSVQSALGEQKISFGHGRALVSIENKKDQLSVFEKIISNGLSVRATERLIEKLKSPSPKKMVPLNPLIVSTTKKLNDILKTKIDLKMTKKGSGYIKIPFETQKDFQSILQKITSEK